MGMRCEQPIKWFIVEMIRKVSNFIYNLMKERIRGRPGLLVVCLLLTRAGGKVLLLLLLLLLRKIVEITGEAHTDISDCLDS